MSNRLILLEGLPGTGKSTNSFKLYEQLSHNGKKVDRIHEVTKVRKTTMGFDQETVSRRYQEVGEQKWYQEILQYDAC